MAEKITNIKTLKFECPHCQGTKLSENVTGVFLVAEINEVLDDKIATINWGNMDYGKGTACQYFCRDCGFTIDENENSIVEDPKELVKWLKDNCKQD